MPPATYYASSSCSRAPPSALQVRLALYRDVLVAVPIFKPLGDSELEMLALSVTAENCNPHPEPLTLNPSP